MADEPDNLVLGYLRSIDRKVDRLVGDVDDLKVRMTSVERGLAGVEMSIAGVQHRIDRIEQRLDGIEKRLELVDGPYGGVSE
jgi:archaellum component FlaC